MKHNHNNPTKNLLKIRRQRKHHHKTNVRGVGKTENAIIRSAVPSKKKIKQLEKAIKFEHARLVEKGLAQAEEDMDDAEEPVDELEELVQASKNGPGTTLGGPSQ
ncbi:hypothetical protein K7432_003066 [Basidiobolus ranarum]|uniref:Uncharacterized protein n=1 Tax=Basidiobolus ranarum TaxID=34480 RepID=A0ABR2W7N3_9FUNG